MSDAPAQPSGFVLALDFGGTKVDVAVAAPDGRVLATTRLATDAARGAEQVVDRAVDAARALMADADGGPLLAVAAASPGIVLDDRILLAPNVPGWGDLALAARLRDGLRTDRVVCATDVKAATLAELRWGALRGADPGVFLNLGTGLAAGIAIGGRVLHGANGAAGEIGYALRGADGDGVLEEAVGGRAIGERAGAPSAAAVFARADAGDAEAAALLDAALDELAVHVANLAALVDPARIAVGGGMMGAADRVLAALRRRAGEAVPFPPAIVPAHFTHDAALHGAVALALEAAAATPEEEQHHEDHPITRADRADVRGRDRRAGGVR
jgi:glucokinase